jgi:hypothetical protein
MELKRFIKLDAAGQPLPNDAKEWAAFQSLATGVVWLAKGLDPLTHEKAEAAAAATIDQSGTGWRLPTPLEFESDIVDRSKYGPAINDEVRYLALDFGSHGYWTSVRVASDPESCAWCVNLDDGNVGFNYRNYRLRARVVRSAVPGQ